MRITTLKTAPFEFLEISDFRLERQVNEHVTVEVSGIVPPDRETEYVEKAASYPTLAITAQGDDGMDKVLFNGITRGVSIQTQNGLRTLRIEAVSRSYLMDIHKHTRTFQDENMTYSGMTTAMAKGEPDFAFLHPGHGNTAIGSLLVQFEETDWQFAKRAASRLNTCIVSDHILDCAYVSIGMPKRNGDAAVDPIEYTKRKDLAEYMDLSAHGVPGMAERHSAYYEFESRETYNLCDPVVFKGRQLYVYSASSKMKGSELVHTYTLKEKGGFCFKERFNGEIAGTSLSGTVREVQNDAVQVEIDGDIAQPQYKWFPYSTVYSSPDGTGWYFMPEKGDRVRLRFPSKHEADAFVISSTHQHHMNRDDPDVKQIATKHGKAVIFRPDSIYITNGAGSSLELDDAKGIAITTGHDVTITAGQDIQVHSGGKVVVQGDKGVSIAQNDSVIDIGDDIGFYAGHVRIR